MSFKIRLEILKTKKTHDSVYHHVNNIFEKTISFFFIQIIRPKETI